LGRGTQRALLAGLTLAAGPLLAAPAPVASPHVVQSLLDCRKLTDAAARLACFDKAAAAMDAATSSGDLVSIDREQRKAARRQAFGFTLPTLSFLEHGEKGEGADQLTATVADANQDSTGRWVVRLEGGAIWIQSEPEPLGRDPHKGSTVVISKGMLGSFFMTIDGQGAGKAKRES